MIKKLLPWFVVVFLFSILIIGFAMKDSMNNYVSEQIKKQTSSEITALGEAMVDSLFNYTKNRKNFEATFMEFGASTCSECKRMEKVLEEVRTNYPNSVNVVFYNVLEIESQNLMKVYGIASILTQNILNKYGKEVFRHTGYISFEALAAEF